MGHTLATTPNVVYDAAEGDKFSADTTLEVVTCATCGIAYAIPRSLVRAAMKWHGDHPNGWKLCCPLGHTWWYVGETEPERLRRILRNEREHSGRLAAERDQARARARAQKAAATRARNQRDRAAARVAGGVCPCCNRTFQNLSRHMAGQHPDYGPGDD